MGNCVVLVVGSHYVAESAPALHSLWPKLVLEPILAEDKSCTSKDIAMWVLNYTRWLVAGIVQSIQILGGLRQLPRLVGVEQFGILCPGEIA